MQARTLPHSNKPTAGVPVKGHLASVAVSAWQRSICARALAKPSGLENKANHGVRRQTTPNSNGWMPKGQWITVYSEQWSHQILRSTQQVETLHVWTQEHALKPSRYYHCLFQARAHRIVGRQASRSQLRLVGLFHQRGAGSWLALSISIVILTDWFADLTRMLTLAVIILNCSRVRTTAGNFSCPNGCHCWPLFPPQWLTGLRLSRCGQMGFHINRWNNRVRAPVRLYRALD